MSFAVHPDSVVTRLRVEQRMNVSASAVSSLAAARRVASRRCCCFFSSSHTHSSSSLPLLLLRSCASAVKLIQSRIRHKQKHQQQCVVRCVVAVALLRLPLPLLPSLLIDTKKMKFKRGGSDAHVSFRFVLSASVGEDDPRGGCCVGGASSLLSLLLLLSFPFDESWS